MELARSPLLRGCVEIVFLCGNDAEPLSRRRFHDDPRAHGADALCSQGFESLDLGFDIVRGDIQVHPAGVIDFLHFDVQTFAAGIQ